MFKSISVFSVLFSAEPEGSGTVPIFVCTCTVFVVTIKTCGDGNQCYIICFAYAFYVQTLVTLINELLTSIDW